MKNHAFAGVEVGRGHAQRNVQLLKCLQLKRVGEKRHHAVVRSEPVAGYRPAREGSKAAGARNFIQFFKRQATAVSGANQRSYAGTGDHPDWDGFIFENLQHADMCHAAGKAAAQSHAYCRNSWLRRAGLARDFAPEGLHRPDDLVDTFHHYSAALFSGASGPTSSTLCKMPQPPILV